MVFQREFVLTMTTLGAVIVSTPQDVALADVSKGIAMLRKVAVPVSGISSRLQRGSCSNPDSGYWHSAEPVAFHVPWV